MGSVTGHNHMPTNPVVDPVGCGSEIAHGGAPHISASRSALNEATRAPLVWFPTKGTALAWAACHSPKREPRPGFPTGRGLGNPRVRVWGDLLGGLHLENTWGAPEVPPNRCRQLRRPTAAAAGHED